MRYVLVDYMHVAHRTIVMDRLSTSVVMNGKPEVIDTTIPTYTIKSIFNYGGRGLFYTGVFFEGGSSYRKEYFKANSRDGSGYKGGRAAKGSAFYDGTNLTLKFLLEGKVSLYRASGYEADDLIYAMIQEIKKTDTETPIDVITNDIDLLPLVDEQVSVYIRGSRQFAVEGCPEHRLYYQVTPDTWEEFLSYTSAYGGYKIPYNSMLLFKMIKGDKADNVPTSIDGMGPVKYTELMEEMEESVSIKKEYIDGIKGLFDYNIKHIFKDEYLQEVIDKYLPNIKEKEKERFSNTLKEMLKSQDTVLKRDVTWVTRRADVTEDVVKFNNAYRDLTKWFDIKELVKDKRDGKDTVKDFERVLDTYFNKQTKEKIISVVGGLNNIFEYGVDFENIFRYGKDFETSMRPVLSKWFTDEEVDKMKFVYDGIGLRGVSKIDKPKQIDPGKLQAALVPLRIHIIG